MAGNRGVVYIKQGTVEVQSIAAPVMANPAGRKLAHAAILKVVVTNICGSDQHMVRGRTTAKAGLVLGHEITGEVIEIGSDVEMIAVGDLVSVPFNVACGRCRTCKEQQTGVCLTVNPGRAGGAYGYVDMGGWIGGQAEYVMVPYADFNLLKFPDRDQAMAKILDLTCLTDILPTGFHGAVTAGVTAGSSVYIAGAGPVGLAAAASAQLLGAGAIIVGDMNKDRLEHAKSVGFEVIDLSLDATLPDQIAQLLKQPEVDCAIDAVGFEAKGHGTDGHQTEAPATVLNSLMEITRAAGRLGIPGLVCDRRSGRPGCRCKERQSLHSLRPGLGEIPDILDGPDAGDEIQPLSDGSHSSGTESTSRRSSMSRSFRLTTHPRAMPSSIRECPRSSSLTRTIRSRLSA
jgi:glutathione-independent formaldehyde dehydrogenase